MHLCTDLHSRAEKLIVSQNQTLKQWSTNPACSPVGRVCGIHWLHLCRYDIKKSDSVASALEFWGMWSTPSLPLIPGPLCLRVLAPERVLPVSQIELFDI